GKFARDKLGDPTDATIFYDRIRKRLFYETANGVPNYTAFIDRQPHDLLSDKIAREPFAKQLGAFYFRRFRDYLDLSDGLHRDGECARYSPRSEGRESIHRP